MEDVPLTNEIMLELESMKSASESEHEKESILKEQVNMAKLNGESHLFCYLTEGLLQKQPDNDFLRFEIAYMYQEIKHYELALKHYKVLTSKHPQNELYQNNIGVAYSNLIIKGKSVSSYKKSMSTGGTIAANNLAYGLNKNRTSCVRRKNL